MGSDLMVAPRFFFVSVLGILALGIASSVYTFLSGMA